MNIDKYDLFDAIDNVIPLSNMESEYMTLSIEKKLEIHDKINECLKEKKIIDKNQSIFF